MTVKCNVGRCELALDQTVAMGRYVMARTSVNNRGSLEANREPGENKRENRWLIFSNLKKFMYKGNRKYEAGVLDRQQARSKRFFSAPENRVFSSHVFLAAILRTSPN